MTCFQPNPNFPDVLNEDPKKAAAWEIEKASLSIAEQKDLERRKEGRGLPNPPRRFFDCCDFLNQTCNNPKATWHQEQNAPTWRHEGKIIF